MAENDKMGGEPRSRAPPVNFILLHSPLRSSDHTCTCNFQPHSHLALNEPDSLQFFLHEYRCFQILLVDPCTLSSLELLVTCRTPLTNVSHALSLINRTRQQCLRGIEFDLLPWGPRGISSTMSCCLAIAVGLASMVPSVDMLLLGYRPESGQIYFSSACANMSIG